MGDARGGATDAGRVAEDPAFVLDYVVGVYRETTYHERGAAIAGVAAAEVARLRAIEAAAREFRAASEQYHRQVAIGADKDHLGQLRERMGQRQWALFDALAAPPTGAGGGA